MHPVDYSNSSEANDGFEYTALQSVGENEEASRKTIWRGPSHRGEILRLTNPRPPYHAPRLEMETASNWVEMIFYGERSAHLA